MNYKQVMGKGSKKISDSGIDKWHEFTDNDRQLCENNTQGIYYVIARDKSMSGWGLAEGRTSYFVEVCWSWRQAQLAKEAISQASEMRNVRIAYKLPTRLNGHVSVYNFDHSARFNKEYLWEIQRYADKKVVPHDSDMTKKAQGEVSDSRKRVKDSANKYYYDLSLKLVNPENDDRNGVYENLDIEHFTDQKVVCMGYDTEEECYDAAIQRAMEYYEEGEEFFSDDPEIEVEGVLISIALFDDNNDWVEDVESVDLFKNGNGEFMTY